MAVPVYVKGTTLTHGTGEDITTIAEVINIDPDFGRSDIDTTDLESDAKESLPGLQANSVSFTIKYDPGDASHVLLTNNMASGGVEPWALNFTDVGTTSHAFSGYVNNFTPSTIENDNILTADVTIKCTTKIVVTTTPPS